ncbi:hypothetical protein GGI43DRAFT_113985 [Trichoderma evansii]
MKEKDNSGVCGIGECDFFFLILLYIDTMRSLCACMERGWELQIAEVCCWETAFLLFECMIMMGGPSTGSIMSQTGYLHTAYAAAISLFYLGFPNFFSVGNSN